MNHTPPSREKILAVARSLFARHGYHGASVRSIISAAHVNLGAVTYHFGGKPGLYEAVLDGLVGPLEERVRVAAEGPGPPLDRIERVVEIVVDHFERNPDQIPIIQHALALQQPLPERARRWIVFLFSTLGRLISEGQADGTIVNGSPALLAASVVAQPFYFAMVGSHLERAVDLPILQGGTRPLVAEHIGRTVRRTLATPRRDP